MSNQSVIATTEFGARSRDALVIQSKPIARVFQPNFNNMPSELTECSTWNTFANASLHRSRWKVLWFLGNIRQHAGFELRADVLPTMFKLFHVEHSTQTKVQAYFVGWSGWRTHKRAWCSVPRGTLEGSVVCICWLGLSTRSASTRVMFHVEHSSLWLHPPWGHLGERSHLLDETRAILAIEGPSLAP